MRAYPIWHQVTACIYNSSKSWGAKDTGEIKIKVGSSADNSHDLVRVATKRVITDDQVIFKFYIDGIKIREAIFENDGGRAGKKLSERSIELTRLE